MPWKHYELTWAHISCYSSRFMFIFQCNLLYPVSCLMELKLFQIVSKLSDFFQPRLLVSQGNCTIASPTFSDIAFYYSPLGAVQLGWLHTQRIGSVRYCTRPNFYSKSWPSWLSCGLEPGLAAPQHRCSYPTPVG